MHSHEGEKEGNGSGERDGRQHRVAGRPEEPGRAQDADEKHREPSDSEALGAAATASG
jgi:hypothetical protein